MNSLFASTARGLEELLKTELESLGAQECQVVQGGVHFEGDTRLIYQSLMWSRLASRIMLPMKECKVYSDLDLYTGVQMIDWTEIFTPNATFAVHFNGVNDEIRNSQYGALRVKDAIVDCFTRKNKERPNVDRENPDLRINVWLNGDTASISLDLSGAGLHLRGYRDRTGMAPIKETLAAAIVMRSGWQPGTPLLDPMCGSGTLLIEAAMLATDRAPGLHRGHWGFKGWAQHDEALWKEVKDDAQTRARKGLAEYTSHFYGSDSDPRVIERARSNARRAGIGELVTFDVKNVANLTNPLPKGPYGTVISNPPYGERLDSEPALIALHSLLGRNMKDYFGGWNLSLFSASPELLSCLQLRADRQFKAKNGPLDCVQKNYHLAEKAADSKPSGVAEDYANRLRKNARLRRKWAKREGVSCYRVYDADLPDYSAAIDLYEGCPQTPGRWLVIAEYAAPKTIDPTLAQARMLDILAIAPRILDVPAEHVHAKARMRSRGGSQYGKQGAGKGGSGERANIARRRLPLIEEGGLTFAVNFDDYLDVGIFLDHRVTRNLVREHAKQARRFLNLFAYTGTATCYAADGGVEETVTVDLSNTYLDWAERNMRQNGFVGPQHHFVRDDVLAWIRDQRQTRNRWDLIFVDPPTFSNSSKMGRRTWDVQRDHVELLAGVSRLLAQGGHAIFSCNLRGFRPEARKLARAGVVLQDITAQTIPEDFARNQKVHHCYIVLRLPIEDAMAEVGFSAEEIAERVEELRNPASRKPRATAPAHVQAGDRGARGNGEPACAGKPKKKKFYASKPKGR